MPRTGCSSSTTDAWVKVATGSTVVGARSWATFDPVTGAMISQRTYKATGADPAALAQTPNDLLTAWCRDAAHGFVTSERHFGGDLAGVPSGNPCTATRGLGHYFINHQYVFSGATLATYTAQYDGTTHLIADETFDANTGRVSYSRDSAGVETAFLYDPSGRLTVVKPEAEPSTTYEYQTNANPPTVIARQCSIGLEQCPTASLTESRYYYDDLGRLMEERSKMPSAQWSARWTTFEAGRTKTRTVPVAAISGASGANPLADATSWDYDFLGRVLKEIRPDDSETSFTYAGVRSKTRTSKIATGVDGDPQTPGIQETPVSVTEQYDGLGRLVAVTENSGPTGGAVTTRYLYDVADRLTSVTMSGSEGAVQNRFFDYDGRGFLRWESHPESGISSYTYDARGNITTKRQGAANTPFDLNYVYDDAERPLKIEERNPFAASLGEPAFRIVKAFEYGTANDTWDENGQTLTNYMKGKLVRSHRFNYSDVPSEDYPRGDVDGADLQVMFWDRFVDPAGRRTQREIFVLASTEARYQYPTTVKSVRWTMEYDDLGQVKRIGYPLCSDCGAPEPDPTRYNMTYAYDRGRLTSIAGFVSGITYWPNGMRNTLVHANQVADTQNVISMPRPSSISFGIYDRCVKPTIVTQPASQQLSGGTTTLSVTVSGTGPFHYQWWKANEPEEAGTAQSITVGPLTTTTSYWVVISSPCGTEVNSDVAVVDVNACPGPVIDQLQALAQPDGSWTLAPTEVSARSTAQYQWRKLPSSTVIGTQRQLAVAAVFETTTWSLTVVDGTCGSDTVNVTLSVPLQITSTGLQATAYVSPSRVVISWPSVSGATSYEVQRRSGPGWVTIATTGAASYTDTAIEPSRTYAYRVKLGQNFSNSDTATTMSFVPVAPDQGVSAANVDSMLDAVNGVRVAAGWPALSWSQILAPSDPLPEPSKQIIVRHVISCRARMNEALQALGVLLQPYTRADLTGQPIQAVDFNEVQDRAK